MCVCILLLAAANRGGQGASSRAVRSVQPVQQSSGLRGLECAYAKAQHRPDSQTKEKEKWKPCSALRGGVAALQSGGPGQGHYGYCSVGMLFQHIWPVDLYRRLCLQARIQQHRDIQVGSLQGTE